MQERQTRPSCLTFTEREQTFDRISHERFLSLIQQPNVDIHEIELSTNSFGEYLFVTVSCRADAPRLLFTFWSLGYHEYRERWTVDIWQWHESYRYGEAIPILKKETAMAQIAEREAFVREQGNSILPSQRAQLFALLAELTDEDGALTELEDMGDLPHGDEENNG